MRNGVYSSGPWLTLILAVLGIVLGLSAIWHWLAIEAPPVARRVPATILRNRRPARIDIHGRLRVMPDAPPVPETSGDWPQFRGADRKNICRAPIPLLDAWPPEGPPVRWRVDLGEGYAGAAVKYGRVYLLDYLEEEQADSLRCFALADGRELWRRSYSVKVAWSHGYSRTVPAVADRSVVTIGPKCHVLCVDALTGEYRWSIDLAAEYGAEVPLWYTGQCPLIDRGRVILAPAGSDVLMMAVDLRSGDVLWTVPNPHGWKMSHSSVMPMTIAETPMYVYFALGGAVGVSTNGALLWSTTAWSPKIVAPSPVHLGDGRIFMTSGHGAGSMLLQVRKTDGAFDALPLKTWSNREFASEQQTPIVYGNRLYTILPRDGGPLRQRLRCMTMDGQITWTSEGTARFGLGPYIVADDKMFILDDGGRLTMARVDADRYEELATVDLLEGKEAWAPMAIADGLLLLRDRDTMLCLDLRKDPRK